MKTVMKIVKVTLQVNISHLENYKYVAIVASTTVVPHVLGLKFSQNYPPSRPPPPPPQPKIYWLESTSPPWHWISSWAVGTDVCLCRNYWPELISAGDECPPPHPQQFIYTCFNWICYKLRFSVMVSMTTCLINTHFAFRNVWILWQSCPCVWV